MKPLTSIIAVSFCTHVLALTLNPAAAIERSNDATTTTVNTNTITKTFVSTEVRSMATVFLWPHRNTSNAGSETSIFDMHSFSGGDSYIGEQTSNPVLPNSAVAYTINKRSTSLYHLKVDLASEGYISVYIPNSTASLFCNTGGDTGDGDKVRPYRLDLDVRNSKQTVGIPVLDEVAKNFCTEFLAAEGVGKGKDQKATGSATTKSASPKSKSAKTPFIADTSKGSTSSHSSATTQSSTKTKSSPTGEITDVSETSSSIKQKATHATSSETAPTDLDSTSTHSSKTKPKSATSEDVSSNSKDTQSASQTTSKIKPSQTESSKAETSSAHSVKSKSKTADAEETGDSTELTASLKKQPTHAISPDSDTTPTSTAADAATTEDERTSSRTSTKDRTVTTAPPPAAALAGDELPSSSSSLPELTTEVPHLTVSSMNTWYDAINSYLATASEDENVASTPVSTVASSNGAAGRRRAAATTAAVLQARGQNAPQLTESFNSWYDQINSYLLTARTTPQSESTMTTQSMTSDPSSNAAIRRVKPPSMLWRRTFPAFAVRGKDNGPDEPAEQEKDHYFEVGEEEKESTKTKTMAKTSSVEEEEPVATKLIEEDEETEEQVGEKVVPENDVPITQGGGAASTDEESTPKEDQSASSEDTSEDADVIEEALPIDGAPIQVDDEATSTGDEPTATEQAQPGAEEDASPTDTSPDEDESSAPVEDNDAEPTEDAPAPDSDTKSTSSTNAKTKSKSKHPHTASTITSSAYQVLTLDASIEFAFASETRPVPVNTPPITTSPLPTPPPGPENGGQAPPGPIIWDPECPHISISTSTATNGATTTVPKTVGLGCWRTLPATYTHNGTQYSTGHLLKASSAWHVLNDADNAQIGLFRWFVLGLGLWCFAAEFWGLARGEWHVGRRVVWWALQAEWVRWWMLGVPDGVRDEAVRREGDGWWAYVGRRVRG